MKLKMKELHNLIFEAVRPLTLDKKLKSKATPEFMARIGEWRTRLFPIYKKVKANPSFAMMLAKGRTNDAFKEKGSKVFGQAVFAQMCFNWVNERGIVNNLSESSLVERFDRDGIEFYLRHFADKIPMDERFPPYNEASVDAFIGSTGKKASGDLSKRAEAPEGSPWGRIAFAQNRKGVPYEENTKEEQEVQDSLVDYLTGNAPLDPDAGEKMSRLIKAGLYKKTLRPPRSKKVYRGVSLSEDELRSYLKLSGREALPESGKSKKPTSVWVKEGGGGTASWTVDRGVAEKFATSNLTAEKEYIVIFEADVPSNLGSFIDMTPFYEIEDISGTDFGNDMKGEREVIAIAPVVTSEISWTYEEFDNDPLFSGGGDAEGEDDEEGWTDEDEGDDEPTDLNSKRYWGRGGAGVMFTCSADNTILLLKRAKWVDQGGTWGVPGGGVEEGWFNTPIKNPITDDGLFIKTAKKEAKEECGSLPPGFNMKNVVDRTTYEDRGFKYVTFVADLSPGQKSSWKLVSGDGETEEFRWFPRNRLPKNLHFGVKFTLDQLGSREKT